MEGYVHVIRNNTLAIHTFFVRSEYNQSTSCMERPDHCSHGEIYRVVTSGVSNLCIRKEKFFEKNKYCIKPNLDKVAQGKFGI